MRILLVGNYRLDAQQSMLRFCEALADALRNTGHDVRVVHPATRLARITSKATGFGKWLAYLDKFVLFVPTLRRLARRADLVHVCDHAYSLYAPLLGATPVLITCHDLLAVRCALREFPGETIAWTGRQYQRLIVRGLERAAFVACDSMATRSDLLRLSRLAENRTAVVHVGFNFPYRPVPKSERVRRLSRFGVGPQDRYMIHVGSELWYKNLDGVVRIFSHLAASPDNRDLRLVMVGARHTHNLTATISDCHIGHKVVTLSNLSGEDLRALYSGSCGLLFPSFCEGFGWPVIEAQACGCPVFASDRAPMTEIGGTAAVYFNPDNQEEAAAIIRDNLSRQDELRAAGLLNARRFSADKTAASYNELYGQIIDGAQE